MPYCKVQEEFPQRVVAVMLMNHFLVEEYMGPRFGGVGFTRLRWILPGKWVWHGGLQRRMPSSRSRHMHFC